MNKNGKEIQCKVCSKQFYISGSRIRTKKYCSFECARKDEFGFKPRNVSCGICGNKFIIEKQLRSQDKYCSLNCRKIAFKEKQEERYLRLKTEIIIGKCKNCLKSFEYTRYFKKTYCSKKCQVDQYSKVRKGKDNPAYFSGNFINKKKRKQTSQTSKHLAACSKYRKEFLKVHDYLFCEVCNVNQNATQRFQVHHIYFASQYPRHIELHNFKNMILVCLECHQKFHAGKTYKEEFEKIEKERGLKELFKERLIQKYGN